MRPWVEITLQLERFLQEFLTAGTRESSVLQR